MSAELMNLRRNRYKVNQSEGNKQICVCNAENWSFKPEDLSWKRLSLTCSCFWTHRASATGNLDSRKRNKTSNKEKHDEFRDSSSDLWWSRTPAILLAAECHVTPLADSRSRDVLLHKQKSSGAWSWFIFVLLKLKTLWGKMNPWESRQKTAVIILINYNSLSYWHNISNLFILAYMPFISMIKSLKLKIEACI